jgi:hypothetical protein
LNNLAKTKERTKKHGKKKKEKKKKVTIAQKGYGRSTTIEFARGIKTPQP